MLEAKPELASFTFFNYSMNVVHYAAGAYTHSSTAAWMPLPCTSTCFWAEGLAEGLAGLYITHLRHIYFSISCGGQCHSPVRA